MSKVSLIDGHIDGAETCVCCGRDIPSGSQYCVICGKTEPRDLVEVTRCRDCKYWDCYGGEDAHKGDCTELVGLESCMYEDDFCSYGERRGKE